MNDAIKRQTFGVAHPLLTVAQQLFAEGYEFDFFQAVRLLERIQRERFPIGRAYPPDKEIVRFRARLSFDFPPSAIYELQRPTAADAAPTLIIAFMGLTGPSGVLPRSYTELLFQIRRDEKHEEKWALRDWLDMFNHRLVSLFYRAWEKYRFAIPYERGEYANEDPDMFTQALFSQIGIGTRGLRRRLRVESVAPQSKPERLAGIDDLALLQFGGFYSQHPRCAVSLKVILEQYFRVDVAIEQFQGQWLQLEPAGQSSLGAGGVNNGMGVNAVIGDRIWDVQSKIRIRLGPMTYDRFVDFIPDYAPEPSRKALFLLAHLVRLYVGPELDVEVQLIVKAPTVPMCRMGKSPGFGSHIGWNCWSRSKPLKRDADQPIFKAPEDVTIRVTHLAGDS